MRYTQDRLEATVTDMLPKIPDHIANIVEGLARQNFYLDVHR